MRRQFGFSTTAIHGMPQRRPDWATVAPAIQQSSTFTHPVGSEEEVLMNATLSVWIALSRNPATIERLVGMSGDDSINWTVLETRPGFSGWSDDHASILPIINYDSLLPRALR